jgi:CubicO group peptidase (beta-lactamase class C family)
MSARRLILAAALLLAAPAVARDDFTAATAAKARSFNPATSVENMAPYTPAETVKGAPRKLPIATRSGIAPSAILDGQAYVESHNAFAFLVLRDGKLVHEWYALGMNADNRFSPASMAKSVMALSFGAAKIPLDAPVSRWLTEWKDDPRGAITVRQLLTMSSGLEVPPFSPDPAGKSAQLTFGPDITATALSFKAVAPPGSAFAYGNANSQLAGVILQRATGVRYADWLSRTVWQPIGASDATVWLDREGGMARTMCCLQATARDWARVGQLILDRGRVGKKQVIPAGWIAEMIKPSATNPNYGLQIWRGSPHNPRRTYSAGSALFVPAAKPFARRDVVYFDGAIGQRVYVVPSERLVIVRIGKVAPGWDDSELPNRILAGIATKR